MLHHPSTYCVQDPFCIEGEGTQDQPKSVDRAGAKQSGGHPVRRSDTGAERSRFAAPLDTSTGARAVPARSTSLGRGGLENSGVFTPDKPLRDGPRSGGGGVRTRPRFAAGSLFVLSVPH